jgi:hypothetical protein
MGAEQKVVAESFGETEADLSTGQRSTLRPPAFETGEFEELLSHQEDLAGPESAETLAEDMDALRGAAGPQSPPAEAKAEPEAEPSDDESRDESRTTKLRRAGGQIVGKLAGR